MTRSVKWLLAVAGLVFQVSAFAQDVSIGLGPTEIGVNQTWRITVTVKNDQLKNYDHFPDITGFRKAGTSSSSQTNIINGHMTSSETVTMTYLPTRQGEFTVAPFTMTVNGTQVSSPGTKVRVGPEVQAQQSDPFQNFLNHDPFKDFFGHEDTEYVNVKEDAFLALTTNKQDVYVGEGFTTTLAFYVAENNRAPLQFYELGKQLADILKKIKPSNCWEENFNIENIEGVPVTIGGKNYTQYKIYQGTFYPLNSETIHFPSVGLEMIKYQVAANPTFFGQNRKEDYKTFYTQARTINVKELPPHPLRDAVAVGDYKLDESLSAPDLETGQSDEYDFRIYGEGNISAIEKPMVTKDPSFDFYEPNVKQSINRQNGAVTGAKTFSYYLVPKDPGQYNLGKYFQWIFFNPKTARYDTLRSQLTLHVTGESKKNLVIQSNEVGSFYERIAVANNTLRTMTAGRWASFSLDFLLLVIVGASVYLVLKK